jgi:GAF domain-containing protein
VPGGPDELLSGAERVLGEHARPLGERLSEVARLATQLMGIERAWVCRVDGEWIRTLGGVAMVLADPRHPPLPAHRGVVGRAVRQMKTQRVDDVWQDAEYYAATALTRSELAVPILAGGHVVGVANFEANRVGAFAESDQAAMEALARLIAPFLE